MGNEICVSRLGALAITLGVGAAVGVVTAAVASASPSDTSSSQEASAVSSKAPGPAKSARGSLKATRHGIPRGAAVANTIQQVAVQDDQSPNLLVNPGAEFGDPSLAAYSAVTIPGWQTQGTPTVIQYGTTRRPSSFLAVPGGNGFLPGFPIYGNATLITPADSGNQFFGGGPVADGSMSQSVDLTGAQAEIDGGAVSYNLGASLGGRFLDFSSSGVAVNFLDDDGNSLGTGMLDTVTPWDRRLVTGFIQRDTTGTIPIGTRSAEVTVTFDDRNPWFGNYNNAYADNISFTIGADLPAPGDPAPPESTVGALDHVFMVYMENKGFDDIVDSRNAPYLNSLIDTYGFATNYYALSHPSAPNYYPILGASDFGVNYNCVANCFDKRDLTENIDDAGKTWISYQGNGGGYTRFSPFLTFSRIYDNPGLVNSHLVPLGDMATDLADPATTPDFVWFFPNDDTNMEGPLDSVVDLVKWAVSQLTTHQYNIKAGDEWLQETIPVILESPTWQDPDEKSAIFLSFDEDTNNTSQGPGNEGNHVVTVIIPSPGAVASGMRSGSFTSAASYNHYSLLRTMEEALGLPPLTKNDGYAQPMNDFWD